MFGKGMMKKVFMYLFLGPLAFLMGGSFNIMDFLMIPMIAPMFAGLLGGLGLGSLGLGGSTGGAGATT